MVGSLCRQILPRDLPKNTVKLFPRYAKLRAFALLVELGHDGIQPRGKIHPRLDTIFAHNGHNLMLSTIGRK
jgi:hypothetical protein